MRLSDRPPPEATTGLLVTNNRIMSGTDTQLYGPRAFSPPHNSPELKHRDTNVPSAPKDRSIARLSVHEGFSTTITKSIKVHYGEEVSRSQQKLSLFKERRDTTGLWKLHHSSQPQNDNRL